MKHNALIVTARTFSALFRPYHMPIICFVALFLFTSLNMLPPIYKLIILATVYIFTILLPRLCVLIYRKAGGHSRFTLRIQQYRAVPYALFILCNLLCLHIMARWNLPSYMCGIIIASLLTQTSCIAINIWWKISIHSAGAGGLIGALAAYSELLMFNPLWWLCITIIIAGIVGTSRMLLRQHSLPQVIIGSLVGTICSYIGIALI